MRGLKPISIEDVAPVPQPTTSEVEHRKYRASNDIWMLKRTKELRCVFEEQWGERCLPNNNAGRRDATVMLDHLAQFIDGPKRIDDFLATWTRFDEVTCRELKQVALASPVWVQYEALPLGQLFGLTWEARCRRGITTIRAIDEPSVDEREAIRREKDAAGKRISRATKAALPKAPSRKSSRLERQIAAIHDALPVAGWSSVTDICKILKRRKHTPFHGLKDSSLRRTVNRAIDADKATLLCTKMRDPPRPDLRASKCVARRASLSPNEVITMTDTTNPIKAEVARPTNKVEFRSYFAAKLARCEVVDELWCFLIEEPQLQVDCGLTDRIELAEMIRARRDEITKQHPKTP